MTRWCSHRTYTYTHVWMDAFRKSANIIPVWCGVSLLSETYLFE